MKRAKRGQEGKAALTDVLKDVDDEERRDEVVDALHVAAGWVADGPNKQDPLKYLTYTNTDKQSKQFVDKTHDTDNFLVSNDMKLKNINMW